jgi:hypothetical protein
MRSTVATNLANDEFGKPQIYSGAPAHTPVPALLEKRRRHTHLANGEASAAAPRRPWPASLRGRSGPPRRSSKTRSEPSRSRHDSRGSCGRSHALSRQPRRSSSHADAGVSPLEAMSQRGDPRSRTTGHWWREDGSIAAPPQPRPLRAHIYRKRTRRCVSG